MDLVADPSGVHYNSAAWAVSLVAAILSVAGASFVAYFFALVPALRTFPARLNFVLCAIDLVWFSLALLSMLVHAGDAGTTVCTVLGPLYHAASLASIGWTAAIAANLALMVRQVPMDDLKAQSRTWAVAVGAVAVLPPLVLAFGAAWLPGGRGYYEPTPYGTCFVSPRFPVVRLLTQTLPALLTAAFAAGVYARAIATVPNFVPAEQVRRVRRRIASRGAGYVAAFALCWVLAVTEDAVLVSQRGQPGAAVPDWVVIGKALLFFGQGTWDAAVYTVNKQRNVAMRASLQAARSAARRAPFSTCLAPPADSVAGSASARAVASACDAAATATGEATGGKAPIFTVVLTGGPCGGKSSSLEHVTKAFSARGFDVYAGPEVPTIIMQGGGKYPGIDAGELLSQFEIALLQLQEQMEDSFRRIALSTGRPSLVILDRAMPDPGAYISPAQFDEILARIGYSRESIMARYDLVVHLVTAADGALPFYTTSNNAARTESAEEAVRLDRAVEQCYKAHPRQVVVGNEAGFDVKLERVVEAIGSVVSLPGGRA
ncbi:hypothetical protein FNF28_04505 [Cafeteria roenbergensis]|uniref:NadR/Ttd14 AAA domain-containing protein n=1 Tax=Cafeteria roenbergensis TaxID=33653 RepID=A0A5A8DF86_CAFRO|nr:hypothetical protein FNF28_04505 [Cafeteria roenbergensis]